MWSSSRPSITRRKTSIWYVSIARLGPVTSCHITFRHIPSYHINTPFECLPNTLLLTPSSLHPTNTLHPTITPYYLTNTLLCTSTYPPSLHIYAAVHEHPSSCMNRCVCWSLFSLWANEYRYLNSTISWSIYLFIYLHEHNVYEHNINTIFL